GSVYQKTNAMSEIKRVNKDNFWAKAEKDEENRRLEEKRRAEEERQRLERERRERELQEAAGREQRYKARSNEIEAQKRLQQQQEAESRDREQQQWVSFGSVPRGEPPSLPGSHLAPFPGKLRSPFLQKEGNSAPSPASPVSPARDASQTSFAPAAAWGTPPASPVPAAGSSLPCPEAAPELWGGKVGAGIQPPSCLFLSEPTRTRDDAKYDYAAEYQQPPELAGKGLCARALYDYQA
ncbi:DBNL protein, partial [Psophia crepitans]|nr:DBNL protein [Psophia crepitans]